MQKVRYGAMAVLLLGAGAMPVGAEPLSDAELNLVVDVPAGWLTRRLTNSVLLRRGAEEVPSIAITRRAVPKQGFAALCADLRQSAKPRLMSAMVDGPTTVNGKPAWRYVTKESRGGYVYMSDVVALDVRPRAVVFTFQTPTSEYNQLKTTFRDVVRSCKAN